MAPSWLLVVEGKAEGVPEGHQRPLHGIGLGLLEGGFMGLAQVGVDAVASTSPSRITAAALVTPQPGLWSRPMAPTTWLTQRTSMVSCCQPSNPKIRMASAITCQPSRWLTSERSPQQKPERSWCG